jgi:hypothetical protein
MWSREFVSIFAAGKLVGGNSQKTNMSSFADTRRAATADVAGALFDGRRAVRNDEEPAGPPRQPWESLIRQHRAAPVGHKFMADPDYPERKVIENDQLTEPRQACKARAFPVPPPQRKPREWTG